MTISSLLLRTLLGLAAPLAAMAASDPPLAGLPVSDFPLAEKLAACTTCHGQHGEGLAAAEYYPHLAGKPAGYLFQQLLAFRDGSRQYAQMGWLLRNMDDAYLRDIAAHFAALPPRSQMPQATRPQPAEAAQRAVQLVREGDPARGVPACAACHGSALTGLEPGIPALVGLPEEYVVAQFGGWLSGVRKASAPDCMAEIARALDPRDIRALAGWLARQGHAQPQPPAAAGSFLPPRACGALAHAVQP
jgi:cytochrome c553